MESEIIYEKIVHEEVDKAIQVRLVINKFRGVEYLHLRKYYLDYSGEWLASKEGVSMPLGIRNSKELFSALVEVLSLAESKEVLSEIFGDKLREIYVQ